MSPMRPSSASKPSRRAVSARLTSSSINLGTDSALLNKTFIVTEKTLRKFLSGNEIMPAAIAPPITTISDGASTNDIKLPPPIMMAEKINPNAKMTPSNVAISIS